MKTILLLSIVDLDSGRSSPSAVFDSKEKLEAGIKRWEKDLRMKLKEGIDYEISEFYLNHF